MRKRKRKKKKGENVKILKNTFESMMRNTEVRKSDHKIVKRKQRKATVSDTIEKPQRKLFESWGGGGSGVKRKIEQEKSEMVVVKNKRKMNEKSDHQLKSESKSTDMSKQNLNLRIHDKVEICSPKLRHSESTADEKQLFDKSTQKSFKNVQKELDLRGKIKIWDKFFNKECTMTKIYCQIVKGGPGAM